MTERMQTPSEVAEDDKEHRAKMAAAKLLIDEEVSEILNENPKARKNEKLFSQLFMAACKADERLTLAVLYLEGDRVLTQIRKERSN